MYREKNVCPNGAPAPILQPTASRVEVNFLGGHAPHQEISTCEIGIMRGPRCYRTVAIDALAWRPEDASWFPGPETP